MIKKYNYELSLLEKRKYLKTKNIKIRLRVISLKKTTYLIYKDNIVVKIDPNNFVDINFIKNASPIETIKTAINEAYKFI